MRHANSPKTAAGHFDLANWCRQHDLPDEERAHLKQVLALGGHADPAAIYKRLGYRLVAGQWIGPRELSTLHSRARRLEASLRTWVPKIETIARSLEGPGARRRAGLEQLAAITDRDAVPAIEFVLLNRTEAGAEDGVRALARLGCHESSAALARQAVFSPWARIRDSATTALKTRELDHFAPTLMGLLVDVRSRVEVLVHRNHDLSFAHLIIREYEDRVELQYARVVSWDIVVRQGTILGLGLSDTIPTTLPIQQIAGQPSNRLASLDALYRRELLADANAEGVDRLNRRVTAVLASVAGQPARTDPNDWWEWWNAYTGVEVEEKPVVIVEDSRSDLIRQVALRMSCLTAGTPVWTSNGPVAVERDPGLSE